jgi:TATA-box binding protein (TBP) (component of TFIID and TFIIIB)
MMATAVQNNGIESLANGNINHIEVTEEVEPSVITNSTNTGETPSEPEPPEIDIVINNVVCSFSVRCHLNLRQIALNGANVEYRRENGVCLFSSEFTCVALNDIWCYG